MSRLVMSFAALFSAVTFASHTTSGTTVAAQIRHVPDTEVLFSGSMTGDGAFALEARGGGLVLTKTSRGPSGFSLDLEAPGDKVAITFGPAGIVVSRNARETTVGIDGSDIGELDRARELLAGSTAVRLARVAASSLQDSEDNSMAAASLLIADTLVGVLTGDFGAPGRMARHLSRHTRANLRRVVGGIDCYKDWEQRVYGASNELSSCVWSFSVWNPTRNLCAFRWILQVESYWFSFLTCSGLSAL